MDIRIENFDVSFGDRVLLTGADLLLAGGRRYGLVGRNGLGKTTMLRMISEKQLQIPSHISILHVEQEVVGDETLAIASVLECDEKLNELWRLEKELSKDPSKSQVSSAIAQLQILKLKFSINVSATYGSLPATAAHWGWQGSIACFNHPQRSRFQQGDARSAHANLQRWMAYEAGSRSSSLLSPRLALAWWTDEHVGH